MSIISIALAEEAATSAAQALPSNGLMSMLPFLFIFGIFYFMLIRPQMKKQKEHESTIASLKKGEKVVLGGGIIGTISKIEDDIAHVEIATDVKVKVMKSTITDVVSRSSKSPAKEESKNSDKESA